MSNIAKLPVSNKRQILSYVEEVRDDLHTRLDAMVLELDAMGDRESRHTSLKMIVNLCTPKLQRMRNVTGWQPPEESLNDKS